MSSNNLSEQATLSITEYQDFCRFLRESAGIDLGENKQYLVATRLRKAMVENQCASFADLTAKIKRTEHSRLRQRVIDDMTTNETFWFRDLYPFDYLKKTIIPDLVKQSPHGRFRLWSAACSSGQEPYSLSMTIEEAIKSNFSLKNFQMDIVATDLSSIILDQAKTGCYDQLSISRGLSQQRLKEFFDDKGEGRWQAKNSLKNRISFRSLNLLDSYASLGKFDIIFCRNVLIYFSAETKRDILVRMHAALKPGGILFLGSSESLAGAAEYFDMVHCNPGVLYKAKVKP